MILFTKPVSTVLSICVPILCIIGMNQFLSGRGSVILLPYAALGFTILFLLLFTVISKALNPKNNQPEERPNYYEKPKNYTKHIKQ